MNASNESQNDHHNQDHRFESFDAFWAFYLGEHKNQNCRTWHLVGTTAGICFMFVFWSTWKFKWVVLALIVGYGCAWWGHYHFEKNMPATFKNPIYSLLADLKMWWLTLQGKIEDEIQNVSNR